MPPNPQLTAPVAPSYGGFSPSAAPQGFQAPPQPQYGMPPAAPNFGGYPTPSAGALMPPTPHPGYAPHGYGGGVNVHISPGMANPRFGYAAQVTYGQPKIKFSR